jgi:chitodextrinase
LVRVVVVVVVASVAAALGIALPAASVGDSGFFVGFTEDLVKGSAGSAVAPAADLGARAFRVTLMWEPGQTRLSAPAIDDLNRAKNAAAGMRLVLAVYANAGSKAPLDAAARNSYCTYVRSALRRHVSIRDVVIWNEPNKLLFWNPQTGAPTQYQALLAHCYDVLHAAFANVNVIGFALSSTGNDDAGSTSPGAFFRAVGDAYRSSGRSRRLLDTVGFHPYAIAARERPWRKHIQSKTIGEGDWNKLAYSLWLAFNGTGQPTPGSGGVSIWYLETGFQTTINDGKQVLYSGIENVPAIPDYVGGEADSPPPAETSAAPDQYTQVLDAVRLAYCQPSIGAYFNFLLADEPRLKGWQSGAYWADLTPKNSLNAFATAIAEANAGRVNCDALKGGRPSGDFMPPTAPTALQGQGIASPTGVVLTWGAASDDASAISYRVYRNSALVATVSQTTWTDTNVTSGATYTYAVRAIDAAGNLGAASSSIPVAAADVTPPAALGGLTAQVAAAPLRVDLTWLAATDDVGVTAYEVLRDGVVLWTTGETAFTDSSVVAATTYSYSVVAFDAAGNRSSPVSASVTTPEVVTS